MFKLATRVLKYHLIGVMSFVLVCWWAGIFGGLPVLMPLLLFVGGWLFRLTMLMLCFISCLVVVESVSH